MSAVAWPYQEGIYHANTLFLGALHGDPDAGSQPEQLEAGRRENPQCPCPGTTQAVGQEMGSFVWSVIDKVLSMDKS